MGTKNFDVITKNLKSLGYEVSCFDTAEEAAGYLDQKIDGKTVGFGGSMTLREMGLYDRLITHNQVFWHMDLPKDEAYDMRVKAMQSQIYISSVNGIAETGEIVNIDGAGNRVAGTMFGHEKVYFVIGENKIEKDYNSALYRARNVAAPKNARRFGVKTPCAAKADRCYNCKSPERICRELSVFWGAPLGGHYEVVLIHETLGY
ncbi:MAG: lactate utilization protein [Bilifractor sp.]